MSPRLSDTQQAAVLRAVTPLERYQRDAFVTALSLLLKDKNEIGDGELFRILRDLQHEHYDFPQMSRAVFTIGKNRCSSVPAELLLIVTEGIN